MARVRKLKISSKRNLNLDLKLLIVRRDERELIQVLPNAKVRMEIRRGEIFIKG